MKGFSKRFSLLLVLIIFAASYVYARTTDPLPSWNEGSAKKGIIDFVQAVTKTGSPDFVPVAERVATFDNDGTLMSEQPIYFQFLFEIARVKNLAALHPEWKENQLFKAALADDLDYLATTGSDGELALTEATEAGRSQEEITAELDAFFKKALHPRFNRPLTDLAYKPMLELLNYLRKNSFKTFIVSGTGIEFLRAWTEKTYGIPPEMVVGSSVKVGFELRDDKGIVTYKTANNFICNGPDKPTGIHYNIGRRPIAAFGNSDGDIQMLQYATSGKGRRLGLLVHHTDAEREWAYDNPSKIGQLKAGLDEAKKRNWVVVDMKQDWKVIFPFERKQNKK